MPVWVLVMWLGGASGPEKVGEGHYHSEARCEYERAQWEESGPGREGFCLRTDIMN